MPFILKLSLLFLFTIITIGCGNANLHEPASKQKAVETTGTGIVAGNVVPQLSVELKEKNIVLHYDIKNQTEHPVTFTFPTSQRFDYIITAKNGDTVKKYSDGRMFSQIVSTVTIKQGESLSFNPVVDDLKRGTYLVTIWLTAKEDEFKTTASFTIE